MTDADDIKARALKAREFTHAIGECSFTLRAPSRHEVRQVAHEQGLRELDSAELALLQHHLLVRYLPAWTGVRLRHLLPPGAPTPDSGNPVPCNAESVGLLLDANPEWADELGSLLLGRVRLRNQAIEVDEKNSLPTLPAPEALATWASSPPLA